MDYMQLFQNYIYIFIYFLWKQMELKKKKKAAHWTVLKQEQCHSLMCLIPACTFVLFWGTQIVVKSQETLSQLF